MTHPHTIINLLGPHAQTTSNKASNECPCFSQTTVSTCYAISLQKVYKLSGKFINLIECLMSFPRQGNNTLRSVHGIVEGWGGGGWLEVLGGGGVVGSLGGGGKIHKMALVASNPNNQTAYNKIGKIHRKQDKNHQATQKPEQPPTKYLIKAYNIK